MTHKIKILGPVEEFTTQYGPMRKYSLQFEGSDDWIKLNQKADTQAPIVGQELEGSIEDDPKWGKQFKKAQGTSGGGYRGGGSDPATRVSIERQSALKAAVEAVRDHSTVVGPDDKMTIEQYVTRIVNVTNVLAKALSSESARKVEPTTDEKIEPAQDDQIDLNDIPF